MSSENTYKPRNVPVFAILCLFFDFLIIAVTALEWVLVEFLTPFLMAPTMICLGVGFIGLTIAGMVYFVIQFRKDWIRAVLPPLINGITFLILWFVPFTDIWLEIEFRLNYQGYNKIIEMVESGEIQPNEIGLARLPPEYRHLSRGGEIMIDTSDGATSVFFFTFRGVLDNFSGYMYRSNDTPPPHYFMGGDWVQVIKQQPQWYFCASR